MTKKKAAHLKNPTLYPEKTTLLARLIKKYGRVKLAIIASILVLIIDSLIYVFFLAPGR